jgi:hypothetical protein
MAVDHKAFLAIAFRELERFSLPGVGTFVRESKPARVDPKTKQLQPPSSYIKLEPGERNLMQLYQYLGDQANLRREQAEKYAQELGHFVKEYTKISGGLELRGVGRITKDATGGIVFEPAMDDPTFSTYALKPVVLPETAPTQEAPPKADKKTGKKGSGKEDVRTARPKGRAAREQQKVQRTEEDTLARARRTSMILFGALASLLLLIIVVMGYAIYLENEARKDSAIYKPINSDSLARAKEDSIKAAQRKAEQQKLEQLRDSLRRDSLAKAEKPAGKKGKTKPATPKIEKPAPQPAPTATAATPALDVSDLPAGATYHLIVGSFDNRGEADAKAALWRRKGYQPTVLPGSRSARFRLSVFGTKNKAALAKKYEQVVKDAPDVWVYSAQ